LIALSINFRASPKSPSFACLTDWW